MGAQVACLRNILRPLIQSSVSAHSQSLLPFHARGGALLSLIPSCVLWLQSSITYLGSFEKFYKWRFTSSGQTPRICIRC